MKRAALLGDGWYPTLFSLRRLRASNETIRKYAAEAGRNLDGFHWGVSQFTAVAHDPKEALESAMSNVRGRYVTAERSAEDIARSLCLVGTPEDCIKGIEERIDTGTRHFSFGFHGADEEYQLREMELLAKEVIPYFRR